MIKRFKKNIDFLYLNEFKIKIKRPIFIKIIFYNLMRYKICYYDFT